MAIYKGDKEIVGLYKGPTEIIKRYKGNNLIYESLLPYSFEYLYNSLIPQYINKSGIPEEYQEVEYIESTGTQYIDSTLIPSATHKFSIRFSVGYLGNCVAFGSRTSGNYVSSLNQIYLNVTNNNEIKLFNIFGTNDLVLNDNVEANTIFTYKNIQNNNCQLSSPSQPYYIFTLNNMGSPSTISNIKMYYFKIYDNNILVRDFIPCYRKSDNVIGLYDKVNRVFYTNAGTGTFLKGNDVKLTVKDKAQVKTIYGNSVVENQLIEDNFGSSTGYWAKNRLTQSNLNNVATFITNSNSYAFASVYHSFSAGQLVKGHYYMYSLYFRITSGNCSRMEINHHSKQVAYIDNPTLNQWYRLAGIVQQTRENTETPNGFDITRRYASTSDIVVDSDTFEAKEPMLIDLTQYDLFYTPTSLTDNRIQALLNQGYIEYNTGTYKGTNIGEFISEPYNLCDGVFQIRPNDTLKRCIESKVIPAIAGKTYVFEEPTFEDYQYRHFQVLDENGDFIREGERAKATRGPIEITLSANECYLRVQYWYYEADHYTNVPSPEILNTCVHVAGTRTGYAPHTQPYTLPFIYQGNSALNAHDTLEITNTEYVFTKNVNNIIYNGNANENWQEYGSGSQRFTILNNLWSSPSSSTVANILCNKLQTYSKNEIFNKEYAISGSDDNVNYFVVRINSSITDIASLKTWLSNNPINVNYELATPQVTRIPKKHLAVVDLGSVNGYVSNDKYFISSEHLGINIMSSNDNGYACYCKDYLIDNGYNVYNKTKDKTMCLTSPFIGNNFIIWDSSFIGKTAEEIKALLSGTYLFYETQDEVADMISDINIEAGGSITTNWFSWVENQNALPLTSNKWASSSAYGTLTDAAATSVLYTRNQTDYAGNVPLILQAIEGGYGSIAGHKYLIKCTITPSASFKFRAYIGTYGNVYNPVANVKNYFTEIITANSNGFLQFISENGGHLPLGGTVLFENIQCIDLTLGFGAGKEPTSIDDPRIQYIIEQGYIPTNIAGTNKSVASEVLPNIDFKIKCK